MHVETVQIWIQDFDPSKIRVWYEEESGWVTCVYCLVCRDYKDKIWAMRNCNPASIMGVTGSTWKK